MLIIVLVLILSIVLHLDDVFFPLKYVFLISWFYNSVVMASIQGYAGQGGGRENHENR